MPRLWGPGSGCRPGTADAWAISWRAQCIRAADFALDGAGYATYKEQASMIHGCIIWRNNHSYDERLPGWSTGRT